MTHLDRLREIDVWRGVSSYPGDASLVRKLRSEAPGDLATQQTITRALARVRPELEPLPRSERSYLD